MDNDVLYNFGKLVFSWFRDKYEYQPCSTTELRLIGMQAIIDLTLLCAIFLTIIGVGIYLIVRKK